MSFLSNIGSKIIFMCSVNFWHQQDSHSLFKGSIGHVTSKCKWPILWKSVLTIRSPIQLRIIHVFFKPFTV